MRAIAFTFYLVGLLTAFGQFMGWGQQKRPPNVDEYALWSTLYAEQISEAGNWASYRKDYENRQDSLFVCKTTGAKTYAFAGATDGRFIGERFFACLLPNGVFGLLDLRSGKRQALDGVTGYELFSDEGGIVLSGQRDGADYIEIRQADGLLLKRVGNVSMAKVSPQGHQLIYACNDGAGSIAYLYGRETAEKMVSQTALQTQVFVNPSWNATGTAVAFLAQDYQGNVEEGFLYHVSLGRLRELNPDKTIGFPQGTRLLEGYNPIVVSEDGLRVFLRFWLETAPVQDAELAQVWNGNDVYIYPRRQQMKMLQPRGFLGVWQVANNTFRPLTNEDFPNVILSGKQDYALTYNPLDVKHPKNLYDEETDFYLTDLYGGARKLWLKGHSTAPYATRVSPGGEYFAYWQGNNWYVYDIRGDVHTSLSALLPDIPFRDGGGEPERHEMVGFSRDDRSVFVSDGTDIWEIDIVKLTAHRITNGVETKITYRAYFLPKIYDAPYFDGMAAEVVDGEAGFIIAARDSDLKRSGYFKWSRKFGLQQLVFTDGVVDQLRISKTGRYVYRMQSYEQPPLLVAHEENKTQKVVAKSNLQHHRFLWGHQELVDYENAHGEPLNGVLYYPAGYVKGRQYPMVVSIYEMQSDHFGEYVNPSIYNRKGFNISDFTARGYLVLEPDISYEIGNPGVSAVGCVTAAVAAVAAKGIIRPDRVGLIGHSFGSYQTNFIITQTGMFAAAVSGAGVADTKRMYLSNGVETARPDLWRFEHQQFRMQKSLFEDPERYRRNSPIEFVKQVNTPLLSWTGDADGNVQPEQTIGFYIALRRLGKKQIMLVYPEEPHNIMKPQNQVDLSRRVREWFDYHLKGVAVEWITKGTK